MRYKAQKTTANSEKKTRKAKKNMSKGMRGPKIMDGQR